MKYPAYYLPPISWFSEYLSDSGASIDTEERYVKQSLRNHCFIDSPQGKIKLTVPVCKDEKMSSVRISEHGDWRHKHWHAIETTYYNSPFFEFLQDDFRPFYEKKYEFLLDFNIALIEKCFELLNVQQNSQLTTHNSQLKFGAEQRTYHQVFTEKHEFLPDLSIIDLIFNMGNEAILYL